MLPASARVRSRSEHRLVAARGRRARRGPIVVHLLAEPPSAGPARAGVVVGKRVGPAVRRNLVKRRLREQLRFRLPTLPDGSLVVVRALPGSGEAGFDRLGAALDSALGALGARTAHGRVDTPADASGRKPRGTDTADHGVPTARSRSGTGGRGST